MNNERRHSWQSLHFVSIQRQIQRILLTGRDQSSFPLQFCPPNDVALELPVTLIVRASVSQWGLIRAPKDPGLQNSYFLFLKRIPSTTFFRSYPGFMELLLGDPRSNSYNNEQIPH